MNANVAAIPGRSNGPTSTRANSHWPEILAAVEDRSVRPAELVRLILMEMSVVCHELRAVSEHSSLEFKLKPLLAELHALRTLAETTRHLTEVAVQTDTVNLDGPKFTYVLSALIDMFKKAADVAECPPLLWETISRSLRFSIAQRELEIRRNIEKITEFPQGAEDSVWPNNRSNESTTNSPENAAAEGPTT
jgi:hypothetical protein